MLLITAAYNIDHIEHIDHIFFKDHSPFYGEEILGLINTYIECALIKTFKKFSNL